jgi:hypothetical protein
MTVIDAVISAGKVGKRFFWVVLPSRDVWITDNALAEGFESSKEEALEAARAAAARLGVDAGTGPSYTATGFYKRYRSTGRGSTRSRQNEPETAIFLGSPYLWIHDSGWTDMGQRYDDWKKHVITRVTAKYVFVLDDWGTLEGEPDKSRYPEVERYKRLDRIALEQDGRVRIRGYGSCDTYYTDAGRADRVAELAETERLRLELCAKRAEELRVSLLGKVCVFCSAAPETYTVDRHPSCRPCYRAHDGYYRMPSNVIVPRSFRESA